MIISEHRIRRLAYSLLALYRPHRRLGVECAQGPDGRCGAALDPELLKNMLQMLLNGAGAYRQDRADLIIRLTSRNKGEYLALALSHWQMGEVGWLKFDTADLHE